MAAIHHIFDQLGSKILAISTDSIFSHKVFAEVSPSGRTIQYPLVSDRSHRISLEYGVLREELGFTYRATFIIAPGGEVKYSCLYPPEVGRNIAEVIRVVQGLQYELATGLGIQAGWRPGKQGIIKDFSLVGRI